MIPQFLAQVNRHEGVSTTAAADSSHEGLARLIFPSRHIEQIEERAVIRTGQRSLAEVIKSSAKPLLDDLQAIQMRFDTTESFLTAALDCYGVRDG
jgi:hypothetical protein